MLDEPDFSWAVHAREEKRSIRLLPARPGGMLWRYVHRLGFRYEKQGNSPHGKRESDRSTRSKNGESLELMSNPTVQFKLTEAAYNRLCKRAEKEGTSANLLAQRIVGESLGMSDFAPKRYFSKSPAAAKAASKKGVKKRWE